MTPFPYNHPAAYRMDQLQEEASTRRMANAVKVQANHRNIFRLRK